MSPPAARIGVVFLARQADGLDAFRRFATSYRTHPAGREHDLIVIYKGFEQNQDLAEARAVFDGLPHHGIELPDVGFDIGSYLLVSRRLDHDQLCFLNTHSAIAAGGWLAHFATHLARDGVGLVGAMGSYESIASSVAVFREALLRCEVVPPRRRPPFLHHFGFVVGQYHPDWMVSDARRAVRLSAAGRLYDLCRRRLCAGWNAQTYRRLGTQLVWKHVEKFDLDKFPPFPNPHIRSNAFMLRREFLTQLDPTGIGSKLDVGEFESGSDGLTARIRRSSLQPIVVARDGAGYRIGDWARSATFRLGDQGGLLVQDNQTRSFDDMPPGMRTTHALITWGDDAIARPIDYPDVGAVFRRSHRAAESLQPG